MLRLLAHLLPQDLRAVAQQAPSFALRRASSAPTATTASNPGAPKVKVYKPSFPFVPAPQGPRTAPAVESKYLNPWLAPEPETKRKVYDFTWRVANTFLICVTAYCILEITRLTFYVTKAKIFGYESLPDKAPAPRGLDQAEASRGSS